MLVVPGSIFAPECRGANRLLRQGAVPICDVSELCDALASVLPAPASTGQLAWSLEGLPENDDPVLAALRTNHLRPDDVARALALDIVTAARRIGALEAAGLVTRFSDGRYGACRHQ